MKRPLSRLLGAPLLASLLNTLVATAAAPQAAADAGATTALPPVWALLLALAVVLVPLVVLVPRTLKLRRQLGRRTRELAEERARRARFQASLEESAHHQAQVRESAALFRAFFEQAAVGVAQIETATGMLVRINPRLCEILGLTASQAVRRDCKTLTHPDDLPANWLETQRLLKGETRRYCLDQRYQRPDGTSAWVALEVSALWEPGARPDYHLALVQDISARKATEFALRRARTDAERLLEEADQSRRALLSLIEDQEAATRALRASEDRYRVLFEGSQVPMFLLDPADGRLVDANRAALAYYGYTREAMLALRIQEINQLPAAAVQRIIARALASECNAFSFPHRLASGELRQVEVHTDPITVGGRTLLYSVVHDITERECAAQDLERQRRRLADLLAARTAQAAAARRQLEQGEVAAALDTLRRGPPDAADEECCPQMNANELK